MTAKEIMQVIIDNKRRYMVFGIRSDNHAYNSGDDLPCSRNMVDDLYDHETGEYPLLDGTCATEIGSLLFDGDDEDIETVQEAIDYNRNFYGFKHLYLVGGYDYEYGDDARELVIKGAEVVCVI